MRFSSFELESFDIDEAELQKLEEAERKLSIHMPEEEVFSADELEQAVNNAFKAGRKDGLESALEKTETEILQILGAIAEKIPHLRDNIVALQDSALRTALDVTRICLRKMFPVLSEKRGLDEICALVESCIKEQYKEPRIVIRVHPHLLDSVKSRYGKIATSHTETPFEHSGSFNSAKALSSNELIFVEDVKLGIGDCHVEWAEGGAERLLDGLWQRMDVEILRFLEGRAPMPVLETEPVLEQDNIFESKDTSELVQKTTEATEENS